MKRILCFLLCITCVFFTGCNSIIYNGNLHFEAFEPETLPDISDFLSDEVSAAEEENMERYNIEGTDAFLILPGHCNNPEQIIDFKVLDYSSDGRLIYAYITPYLGNTASESGLTVSATGNGIAYLQNQKRDREENGEQDGSGAKKMVTVLMAYQPYTGAYQVFFSRLSTMDSQEVTLSAHKLADTEEYFLFFDQAAYLYDRNGKELYYFDASTLILQEVELLAASVGKKLEVTISDVVMDESHYLYIPIICRTTEDSNSQIDENTSEDEFESTVIQRVLVCYDLDISGRNSDIVFYSDNQNWEKQKKLWLEKNNNKNNPFENEAALKAYMKNASLANIKAGTYGKCADLFDVFYTKNSPINLELAGVADLNKFTIDIARGTESNPHTYTRDEFLELCQTYMQKNKMNVGVTDLSEQVKKTYSPFELLLKLKEKLDERIHYTIMSGMVVGSQSLANFFGFSLLKNFHYVIPGIRPGAYNAKSDSNPWNLSNMGEEALFAYKTTGTEANKTSKYAIIRTEGRFSLYGTSLRPVMERYGAKDSLSRTLYYKQKVQVTSVDENGKKVTETQIEIRSVKETASAYNHYRVVMPVNTSVCWVETLNRPDMVAAAAEWGAIYYTDVISGDTDEKSFSKIEYHNGIKYLLRDYSVQGKAKDAKLLYNGSSRLLVFVTSTGVKLYPYQNGAFNTSGAQYVNFEDIMKTGDYTLNEVTLKEDGEYTLTPEQKESIEKNLNKTGSSESYEASAFTLAGDKELLISSLYNGLIHYDMNSKMSYSLLEGAYYSSFQSGSGKDYVVIGYQTSEYSYLPRDLCRAKVYKLNLTGRENEIYGNAVKNYLEDKISSVKASRYVTDKTAAQKQDESFVNQMFYSTEKSAETSLDTLLKVLGLSNMKAELLPYVLERRTELLDQQTAIVNFYHLAGILRRSGTEDEKLYQAMEEALMKAYYTSDLEMRLVQVKLFETAVDQIGDPETKERYRTYQADYAAYLADQAENNQGYASHLAKQSENNQGGSTKREFDSSAVKELMLQDFENSGNDSSSKTSASREGMEKMSFYQEVLADVKAAYENTAQAAGGVSWESYLKTLLSMLTEGNAADRQAEALNTLCSLMGRTEETLDMASLEAELAQCRSILSLEELIVAFNLDAARYQSSDYSAEYEAYLQASYENQAQKREAFEAAGFYRIITDAKARADGDWDELMSSIIINGGSGIVLKEE